MRKTFQFIAVLLFLIGVSSRGWAKIQLPSIIGDNMVLQRNADDPLWGWASPGEEVTIKANWPGAETIHTRADDEGRWKTKVSTPDAGGPYIIHISGENAITLHHVMIGEVWLCSGQSNMEMPVQGWGKDTPIRNSNEEISAAHFPNIRLFTVRRHIALTPQQDVRGKWSKTTPETVADFSATAYFFGRKLYQKLKVPIGLIHSSWGGTPAEAWTSGRKLRDMDMFTGYLDTLKSKAPYIAEIRKKYQQERAAYQQKIKTINKKYARPDFDDSGWKSMPVPSIWENHGLPAFDGVMWYRKDVVVPDSWAGKELTISLGPIDDKDISWFNGTKIGQMQQDGAWSTKRIYTIPGKAVKAGRNVIAVRVTDTGGGGGINGDKSDMLLYPSSTTPDEGLSLAGPWKYKKGARMPQPAFGNNPNGASVLYNGMIAPLIPYHIRGAIWYQGESNVGRANQYATLFPGMIEDWRSRWNEGDFPFYFVQIAPYRYSPNGGRASAALRDAQRRTLSLPNTGMASTLDIGNFDNIHPANKQSVGNRLFLWASNRIYGGQGTESGPLYQHMEVRNGKAILTFDHIDGGLIAKNGGLRDFEISGEDGKYVPAVARIKDDKVIVSSAGIRQPQNVRYDWSDTPVPTLYNRAGLPASSFTTEPSLTNYK